MQIKLKITNFDRVKSNNSPNTALILKQTPCAQLHMLTNINVNFHDSRSNTFGAMLDTSSKVTILTKSRAINLSLLNGSNREPLGAQLHMLINIPVNFQDSRSNTFGATLHIS